MKEMPETSAGLYKKEHLENKKHSLKIRNQKIFYEGLDDELKEIF